MRIIPAKFDQNSAICLGDVVKRNTSNGLRDNI